MKTFTLLVKSFCILLVLGSLVTLIACAIIYPGELLIMDDLNLIFSIIFFILWSLAHLFYVLYIYFEEINRYNDERKIYIFLGIIILVTSTMGLAINDLGGGVFLASLSFMLLSICAITYFSHNYIEDYLNRFSLYSSSYSNRENIDLNNYQYLYNINLRPNSFKSDNLKEYVPSGFKAYTGNSIMIGQKIQKNSLN